MAAMMLVVNSTVRERASNRTRDASTARLPITTTSNGKGRTIYPLSTTTLLNIYSKSSAADRFAVYPLCCSLGLLGFALRDSAAARPRQGAVRRRGGSLAGGASRIRGASGSERPKRR